MAACRIGARQTIVPVSFLSCPSPAINSLRAVDTNRFGRLLDVWSYVGSRPFPEIEQHRRNRKRPIENAVVDLKDDRCQWIKRCSSLGVVYIRRLCKIIRRYGSAQVEVSAMLVWRIFWEGIPADLRSSIGVEELQPDRLEEPLCCNLDCLFGDFAHIKDLFGPETWKWIFDDVLQRTFSECVAHVRMCVDKNRKVIPSMKGVNLVAYTISQRDNKSYIFW